MFFLSRLLLIVAVAAGIACAALAAVMAWPASGWPIVIFFFALLARRRAKRLTTLGSARWASEGDLRRTGMLGAETGLILGRLPEDLRSRGGGIRALFDRRISAKEACRRFWAGYSRDRRELVRLPRAIHTAVFSPSGGGKGVSCVVPFLLSCPEACVVVDFKGENAMLTANYRRKVFGHQIVLLDPFKVVTQTPDTFNPLDGIDATSPYAIDDCNELSKALVVRNADEREPHWNDSAEAWIASLLGAVVQYGERDESRSLQMLRDLLSHPQKLEMAIKLLCESDAWDGMLARLGGALLHFVEKEKSSTLTTVGRHLRFLDTPAVAASTKCSSFDPAKLRLGKMTVYLILPPTHMRSQTGLLRVWIGSLLRAVVAGGLQEKRKVHFVLDEAASLGHLDAIDDAVDKYRGYAVRLQFYFQSLGQLRKCFPEGQEQTLLSNCSQVFFGVNDNATADYVSTRLGESTIIVDSGGSTSGNSTQWSESVQPSSGGGTSSSDSRNWQQQVRRLLKPEEVMALSARTAITFTPEAPPLRTTLLRYYEERRGFGLRRGLIQQTLKAWGTLVTSSLLCAGALISSVFLAEIVKFREEPAKAMPGDARIDMKDERKRRPGVPAAKSGSCTGVTPCPKPQNKSLKSKRP